ncbi:MAG: glycosyltransferase [Candidatus Saccharimonas sp.]
MKILIATDLHWPVLNGVATFSRNLARGMAARGHEVVVIAPSQDGKKHTEIDGNYTIYRTKSTIFPFYQNFRISVTPQLEVRKIIQDFQPDIIHIQMILGIGQAATLLGRWYDIPIVSTSHAMAENLMDNLKKAAALSAPINYMLRDFGRRFHNRSDAITSPTKSGLQSFGKHAEKVQKPVEIISNGIDLTEYQPGHAPAAVYKKYGLPTDIPIVTYIGRVDAEKHLWVLVKAMRRVLKTTPAHLLVVGSGVDLDHMKHLAIDLGIGEHATFTGRVSDEDKLALEHVGAVYAIPSPAELQSIATLEAMACGQPIVAVNAGALGELCHDGKNGYLFALDDDEGMAEGIVRIITNPDLRAKMSNRSLAIAKTHDLEYTLAAFESLYNRTIAAKQQELAERPAGFVDRIKESELKEYMEFWSREDEASDSNDDAKRRS